MVRALSLLALLPAPAEACRLALVLAIDVSSSVDEAEDALQRGGLAAALRAPVVQNAFFLSPDPVALAVFEWSGRYNQVLLADWTIVTSPIVLQDLATQIETSKRSHNDFPTAMGYALGFASTLLENGPTCLFQTIDVAGDGENNDGIGPADAYNAFPLSEVTVNGLVIDGPDLTGPALEANSNLIPFYLNEVIKGPGSFIEVARGFSDYANAMERKLVRELSAIILGQANQPSITPG